MRSVQSSENVDVDAKQIARRPPTTGAGGTKSDAQGTHKPRGGVVPEIVAVYREGADWIWRLSVARFQHPSIGHPSGAGGRGGKNVLVQPSFRDRDAVVPPKLDFPSCSERCSASGQGVLGAYMGAGMLQVSRAFQQSNAAAHTR